MQAFRCWLKPVLVSHPTTAVPSKLVCVRSPAAHTATRAVPSKQKSDLITFTARHTVKIAQWLSCS